MTKCEVDNHDEDLLIQRHFDKTAFEAAFMQQCYGKEYCAPVIMADVFIDEPVNERPNYLTFAQVECTQTVETVQNKYLWTLVLGFLVITISVVYYVGINEIYV